jgi:hypothetical protein
VFQSTGSIGAEKRFGEHSQAQFAVAGAPFRTDVLLAGFWSRTVEMTERSATTALHLTIRAEPRNLLAAAIVALVVDRAPPSGSSKRKLLGA